MISANPPELLEENEDILLYKLTNGLKLRFYTGTTNRDKRLFFTTGSTEFINAFQQNFSIDYKGTNNDDTDKLFFEKANIQYIEPFLREHRSVIEKAKTFSIPAVIQPIDIKGIIHSHSNWSDGSNTIEDMAKAAADKGLEYLVISDHSKSAFLCTRIK